MTIDVTIGKAVLRNFDNKAYAYVDQCPDADKNICEQEYTLWEKEAYRSGSTGFWEFFFEAMGEIYNLMRDNPRSNDLDVAYIKPFIKQINSLQTPKDPYHKDRMKWFKYWCNKAVELYDDDAGIMFS